MQSKASTLISHQRISSPKCGECLLAELTWNRTIDINKDGWCFSTFLPLWKTKLDISAAVATYSCPSDHQQSSAVNCHISAGYSVQQLVKTKTQHWELPCPVPFSSSFDSVCFSCILTCSHVGIRTFTCIAVWVRFSPAATLSCHPAQRSSTLLTVHSLIILNATDDSVDSHPFIFLSCLTMYLHQEQNGSVHI